ncbi:MAG: flagellar export protein FliJ [Lachnospiraceae bacterium]|nr:flagellar export protein FliJ [Lachnospiraceae bacterium]
MARFIYRMQNVLEIKLKIEDQAKTEFATAKMHLDEEEEKLRFLMDRRAAYVEQGRMLRKDSLKVREILENRAAIDRMDEYISFQLKSVEKARQKLESAREHLKEAMQESKTHERLREKAFDQFIHEENVKEAKEIDELTSYVHSRTH